MPSKRTKMVPTYIKSLTLENIRCFGSRQELSLLKSDGTLPQWTILLGDNGVGKTTLLQCLVWMRPVPRDVDENGIVLNVNPALLSEENEVLLQLIRSPGQSSKRTGKITATYIKESPFDKKVPSTLIEWKTGIAFTRTGDNFDSIENAEDLNSERGAQEEINLFTYSASRRTGKLKIDKNDTTNPLAGIFDETTQLYDPEDILKHLEYGALKEEKTGKRPKRSATLLELMNKMLLEILPQVNEIKILGPDEDVIFSMPYGEVPFSNISLGYKTTLSWTIDFAWRLISKFKNSENPLAEPSVVLIDEIDLHLHPLWQRTIINLISKHFPRTQFIATAHSPIMVQAAFEANHAVLKQERNEVSINNEPMAIYGWRIDQILTSNFFDLPTSRGPKYEELLSERRYLLHKKNKTSGEKAKLNSIEKQISDLPTAEKPEDIKAMELIREVVKTFKNDKNKKTVKSAR